jgi:hypothetical protein
MPAVHPNAVRGDDARLQDRHANAAWSQPGEDPYGRARRAGRRLRPRGAGLDGRLRARLAQAPGRAWAVFLASSSPRSTVEVACLRHRPVEFVLGPAAEAVQQLPDDTGIGHGRRLCSAARRAASAHWGNAAPTAVACSSNTVAQTPSRAITTASATCTIFLEAIRQTRRITSGSVEALGVSRARAKTAWGSAWNPAATAAEGLVGGRPGRRSSPQMHTASSRRKTCKL